MTGNTRITKLIALFLFCLPAAAFAQNRFEIVPSKSEVKFTISTTFNTIEGKAKTFSGHIDIPSFPGDLASSATATINIDPKSMETGNKGRDKDMHQDVLEVDTYKDMKLVIKKITADTALYTYKVSAELTMHGVTKTIDFKTSALSFPGDGGKSALSISGKVKVDITSWGMTPPNIVVNKVSPKVTISWSLIAQQK